MEKRKWNNSTSDHELTWNPRTIATGPLLNSLKLEYKFKPIHEVQDVSDGTDVDVLAWVKMASDVVQFTARSGIEYKVIIFDLALNIDCFWSFGPKA